MKYSIRFIILLICCGSCNEHDEIITYYPDGQVKEKYTSVNGEINGLYESYYESGNIKYTGEFKDNKRIGKHSTYYDLAKVMIKRQNIFTLDSNNEEVLLARSKVGTDSVVTYQSQFVSKDIKIDKKGVASNNSDSVELLIEIRDPKYSYTSVYIGNVSSKTADLGIAENELVKEMSMGNSIRVPLYLPMFEEEIIKGYIVDFDIKMLNDSIGVTIAEETYFEYNLN